MNYLSIENLSKSYGIDALFSNLSFGVQKGEKVGLIASNGSGKSTLFKILAGLETADSGIFTFRKEVKVGYLGQKIELDPKDKVIDVLYSVNSPVAKAVIKYKQCLNNPENSDELQSAMELMDELQAWDYENKAGKLSDQFGIIDLEQKVGNLSGGQQKRLALVKLLLEEPEFLLLDEPTNHLDIPMIEYLEEYLSVNNFTLLLITHDRYFLDAVCDRIIEFDQGIYYQYKGGYDYYLEKKAAQEAAMASEVDKAKNLMRKELEWIRRQPKARTTKSKSRVDAFDGIVEKAKSGKKESELSLEVNMTRMGSKILELHNVSMAYGDKNLINNFKYVFKKGEKIGIVGDNGTGKSTLLEIIMGNKEPDTGKVVTGETIEFGYYRQDGMKLKDNQRVIEAVKDIAEVIPLKKGKKLTASQLLERFLFPRDMHYNQIEKLSGGEKRRLFLLTILMHNPNFLILDEPTNDFDIATLTVLEDFLADFPGCLLVVTHDRYFMDKVVDHLLIFKGNGELKGFNGSYTNYRIDLKAKKQQEKVKDNNSTESKPGRKKDNSNQITYKDKREFEQLEKDIETLEGLKKKLIDSMNNALEDHVKLLEIGERLSQTEKELDVKSNRWLELSEKF